ncbi:MAG: acyl carrier protein [Lachnospiraceae bacterium]|nr:acyl carrier protein [Lachnospiraceae bacterium]
MTILEILKEIKPECDFEASSNFIDDALLDSYEIVELVEAMEDEYGIFIDGMEILPENFVSIEAIQALVDRSEKQE